jgi:hypothetical protein
MKKDKVKDNKIKQDKVKHDKAKHDKAKHDKAKRKIYIRTFTAFMVTYLVLMAGLSIFLLNLQCRFEDNLCYKNTVYLSSVAIEDVLQNNIDSNNQMLDTEKFRKDCADELESLSYFNVDLAIFTRDGDLIYHSNNKWLCAYKDTVTKKYSKASIYLEQWFTKEEIAEINNYMKADPNPKKEGDIYKYNLVLDGLWLDHGLVIPDKIVVTTLYAKEFDQNGTVLKYDSKSDIIFSSNYENTKELPYYQDGYMLSQPEPNKTLSKLSDVVLDKDRLQKLISEDHFETFDRVNLITARYYCPVPFPYYGEAKNYGDYWIILGFQKDLLKECIGSLLSVWISCFVLFMVVAFILSTQNHKIYRKRVELDKLRSETTNALAHDLKTPLSIISGYAQNLIENIHNEKRDYYANNINVNVNRMDRILREMLELSRYDTDFNKLIYEDVSLGEVCAKLIERYSQVCNERQFTVSLKGDAIIKAEFSFMERVIDNFFVNAIDFTPDAGIIRISIFDNTLELFNSGSHIPEDVINEIWQPYKKADNSRSNKKGSGLGLSISAKILNLYKFSYGAENVDDGVTFWFKW